MVIAILEGLRKGHAIAFRPLEPETQLAELHEQVQASLESPRVSWEQGLAQVGL